MDRYPGCGVACIVDQDVQTAFLALHISGKTGNGGFRSHVYRVLVHTHTIIDRLDG